MGVWHRFSGGAPGREGEAHPSALRRDRLRGALDLPRGNEGPARADAGGPFAQDVLDQGARALSGQLEATLTQARLFDVVSEQTRKNFDMKLARAFGDAWGANLEAPEWDN